MRVLGAWSAAPLVTAPNRAGAKASSSVAVRSGSVASASICSRSWFRHCCGALGAWTAPSPGTIRRTPPITASIHAMRGGMRAAGRTEASGSITAGASKVERELATSFWTSARSAIDSYVAAAAALCPDMPLDVRSEEARTPTIIGAEALWLRTPSFHPSSFHVTRCMLSSATDSAGSEAAAMARISRNARRSTSRTRSRSCADVEITL